MPVSGMAGTVAQQASEFFLRTSFPFIFSGLLPVSGVILASATDSDLGRIVTGHHKSSQVITSHHKSSQVITGHQKLTAISKSLQLH